MADVNKVVDDILKLEKGSLESIPAIGDIATENQRGILENEVANFAYTKEAFDTNDCQGAESFDFSKSQNIPANNPTSLNIDASVLDTGFQTNAASTPRDSQNHFWGRVSYNLNKIHNFFANFLSNYKRDLSQNNNLYSPTASYLEGDVCFFVIDGEYYQFVRNATGNQPSTGLAPSLDSTFWDLKPFNEKFIEEKAIEGYGQKTDCILKAGLNLDLEWTDTTLTLKAGSTVCLYTGEIRTNTTDLVGTTFAEGTNLLFWRNNQIFDGPSNKYFSSNIDPSGTEYSYWYNYNTRKVFTYFNGAWTAISGELSIPFAQVTVTGSVITDVQKLDTVSYFGKTGWLLPDVEYLVPAGRDASGKLLNTNYKSSFIQRNLLDLYTQQDYFILEDTGIVPTNNYSYNAPENSYYLVDGTEKRSVCRIGSQIGNGTVITSMKLKRPFFAADVQSGIYGDTNTLPASEIKELAENLVKTSFASSMEEDTLVTLSWSHADTSVKSGSANITRSGKLVVVIPDLNEDNVSPVSYIRCNVNTILTMSRVNSPGMNSSTFVGIVGPGDRVTFSAARSGNGSGGMEIKLHIFYNI